MHSNSAGNGNSKSDSCDYSLAIVNNLQRAECHTHSRRSEYLYMESFSSIECINGSKRFCESGFNNNIHSDRKSERVHSNSAGDSNSKSPSGNYTFAIIINLQRAECHTHSRRSEYLYMESLHCIEYINRSKCFCKSCFNNNIYCDRKSERMHSNSASHSNSKSASGDYSIAIVNNLQRAERYAHGKRSEYLYMESVNGIERINGSKCFC